MLQTASITHNNQFWPQVSIHQQQFSLELLSDGPKDLSVGMFQERKSFYFHCMHIRINTSGGGWLVGWLAHITLELSPH